MWGFMSSIYSPSSSGDILQLYQVLYLSEIGNNFQPLGDSGFFMISYDSGDTTLLFWDHDNKKLKTPPVRRNSEHEGEVLSISSFKNQYYYTTGADGWLKIWNC